MQFERKHYIYIILAILLSLIAIDGTGTIINYNNYTNGSSNGSFYNDINMNENNITEITELRNNGTLYTPYINLGSSKIELGTKFLGSPLKMWDLQITGMNSYYNLNMNNKSLLNCLNCANKTELNEKVNKSGELDDLNLSSKIKIYSPILNGTDLNFSFESIYNGTVRTQLYAKYGVQEWKLNDALKEVGWVTYSSPYANAGIVFYNNSTVRSNRSDIRSGKDPRWGFDGISFAVGSSASARLSDFAIKRDTGEVYINNLSGTGYAFPCLDENGRLLRSSIACDLI